LQGNNPGHDDYDQHYGATYDLHLVQQYVNDHDGSNQHHHHGPNNYDIIIHDHDGAGNHDHHVVHYDDYDSHIHYGPADHDHRPSDNYDNFVTALQHKLAGYDHDIIDNLIDSPVHRG
jgi:hypothetical protein